MQAHHGKVLGFVSRAGKPAALYYNSPPAPIGSCKTPAGTSVAIEDLDFYGWSWANFSESYICFMEDFNANTEILTICGDGDGDDDDDSDDDSLALILGVVGAVLVVGIVVFAYFWSHFRTPGTFRNMECLGPTL